MMCYYFNVSRSRSTTIRSSYIMFISFINYGRDNNLDKRVTPCEIILVIQIKQVSLSSIIR